jgi:TonB family protein
MTKEIFFSLIGHVSFFFIILLLAVPNKRNLPKPYPMVYRVSLFGGGGGGIGGGGSTSASQPGVAVVNKPQPKTVATKKPSQVAKPTPTSNGFGLVGTKSGFKTKGTGGGGGGGGSGYGGTGSGFGVGGGGFEYSYYLNVVLTRIGENWVNPYQTSNYQFNCSVQFVIQRDGLISEAKIETSSKNSIYDQSALRAVLATRNLPPLPQDFKSDQLKLHLEFEYQP